jgi:UDP-glucose 4-epimerase
MKCLLLGGGGFLGLNIAKALTAGGHRVRIFDRTAAILRLQALGVTGYEWAEGDFANEKDVTDALEGCEVVFHLVSTTLPKSSNENPAYDLESNVVSTIHMLEAARRKSVKMVLFASSGGTVYGVPRDVPIKETHPTEPTCSYGIGKLAIENYLRLYFQLYGIEYRILRIANPYGEEQRPTGAQGAVAVFLSRAMNGQAVEVWGDGSVVRDFLYVGDVSRAFVMAMNYRGDTRLFNIGAGAGHSLNELLAAIESTVGSPIVRNYLPARGFDVPSNVLDISRAREILGFQPIVGLPEGLARTLAWLRRTGNSR